MIDRSHGGNIWQYPKSSRPDIIDFSVNTNPLGMAKRIKSSILRSIDEIEHYPDPDSKYLKSKLAKFHGLSSHNFLAGNGSIELIHLIPRALKAKVVLIPIPTFSEYEFAAGANGAKCVYVKNSMADNFKVDVPGLIRRIPGSDLVFLCNPNNPTGSVLERREILSVVKACKRYNATLVIDEAFMDFTDPHNRIGMDRESAKTKNLLVLKSLTKFFVVPGIRIGYVIGHEDTIDKLSRHTYPWNVNTMAQIMAREAVGDREYTARTQGIVPAERKYLYENLNKIRGLKAYPSEANFLLCRLEGAGVKSASSLSKKLIRRGILIRSCHNFRGLDDRFFRIAVKTREANIELISALDSILT